MGTYPPALVLIGICCWPNLRIFVYGILGVEDDAHLFREPHFSADELVSLRIEQVPPLGPGPQVILLLRTTTPGSQKSGGAGLGLYSWLLLSNVDTAQLALRNSCPALPCPALPVPLPAGLHACLGQKTTKYIHGRAGAFPSHRKYSTPVRDCTRPGGIARQEESCISLPLLCPPSPSTFSLHDNHIPTIQQYTFDLHSTRSCSLTAISIYHLHFLYLPAPSLFTLPTTSSVAYLELQRSSLPPTTPTTPLVNNRRRLCVLGRRAVSSHSSAGLARLKADPVAGKK